MQTIAFDAASSSNTTGGSPFTWSHTCTGSNRILIVGLINAAGDQVTGVTYNGVAMTQINKQNVFGGTEVYLYYLLAPATGSNTISVSKSSGNMAGAAASYTGVKQSGQPDASTTATTGSSTTHAEALTSIADNCWHVSGVFGGTLNAISAGTGTTVRVNNTTTQNAAIGDNNAAITPAGSNTLNFSASSMNWASNGITISPAPDIYTLTAGTGSFTFTGNAALFYRLYTLTASVGSFVLTGVSATLTHIIKWAMPSRNSSSQSNQSKNSSSWVNQSKDSSTFNNQTRN